MKKLIYVLSFSLLAFALQQCRSADLLLDDHDDLRSNIISEEKINDSTRRNTLYPDPPIKDGHDWKNLHQ